MYAHINLTFKLFSDISGYGFKGLSSKGLTNSKSTNSGSTGNSLISKNISKLSGSPRTGSHSGATDLSRNKDRARFVQLICYIKTRMCLTISKTTFGKFYCDYLFINYYNMVQIKESI